MRDGKNNSKVLPRADPTSRASRHARSAERIERDDQEIYREVSAVKKVN